MRKIGNTRCWVLTCLHQYFTYVAWGGEVAMSSPHPDAADRSSAATFSVVSEYGDAEIDPTIKTALKATAGICWSLGQPGEIIAADTSRIPSDDGGEIITHTITIKKRAMPSASVEILQNSGQDRKGEFTHE